MSVSIHFAARTHRGLVRTGNEDSLYAGPRFLAIADGMGGHVGGEVASRIVIRSMAPLDEDAPPGDLLGTLRTAAEAANNALRAAIEDQPDLEGMGTTLTAMLFDGTRIGMVHIGDSRAYLRSEGETSQISHDDTLVQKLVDEGKLTPEQASVHPHRSAILYALMGNDDIAPDLSIREARVGDRYLLCSDGVSDLLHPRSDHIPDVIADALAIEDPEAAADRLIELSLQAGGRDNISCIIADVVEEGQGSDAPVVEGAAAEPVEDESPAALQATDPRPKRQRFARRRRRVIFGLGLVVLLLAAAAGLFAWTRTQYFVKATGDQKVAIYRGVNTSIGGIHLYQKVRVSSLQVADLVGTARKSVHDGLAADGRSDADAIVANLTRNERLPVCPPPAPTQPPRTTPPPTKHQPGQKQKKTKPTPTPTPTPTPSPTPPPVPGKDCR
ncbi:MAG TPA: protein phosphatase 2C domain-containing protein [Mycobacteriales bacterium]|nr:protein phosphatase 2C domain-containing protein [Mycobacteriales bacterium]